MSNRVDTFIAEVVLSEAVNKVVCGVVSECRVSFSGVKPFTLPIWIVINSSLADGGLTLYARTNEFDEMGFSPSLCISKPLFQRKELIGEIAAYVKKELKDKDYVEAKLLFSPPIGSREHLKAREGNSDAGKLADVFEVPGF